MAKSTGRDFGPMCRADVQGRCAGPMCRAKSASFVLWAEEKSLLPASVLVIDTARFQFVVSVRHEQRQNSFMPRTLTTGTGTAPSPKRPGPAPNSRYIFGNTSLRNLDFKLRRNDREPGTGRRSQHTAKPRGPTMPSQQHTAKPRGAASIE